MASKTHPVFTNFNSGELSPKVSGRLDLTRYHNGVYEMRNWFCLPQGGVRTRYGTIFVAEVKYSLKETTLIPFMYSELQNYIIEAGDQYMRFYMNCGQVMVTSDGELVTNGTFDSDITGWTNLSTETGSIAWFDGRMRISGGTSGVGWAEQGITTVVGNLYLLQFDVGDFPLKLRIGTGSGGNQILSDTEYAISADQILFFVARSTTTYIQFKNSNNNLAELDNVSCKLAIPYEINTPYKEKDLFDIRYAQDDENLYLVHGDYPPKILTRTDHNAWSLTDIDFIDGPYEDEINTPTITPSATTGTITLTASSSLFLPGHVGALWRIRHGTTWGYVKITGYTSETVVTALVKKTLGGTTPSSGHREGAWSDVNGWPRTVGFYEGRILYGSSYEWPNTIWGSKSGSQNYNNFTPGTLDDDPYIYTLSDVNIIRWIKPARVLCLGGLDGETTLVGPNDGPITPTSPPRVRSQTTHGSSSIDPLRVGKSILFLQKAERKIREFAYSYEDDAYSAHDITILAEHLMKNGIVDMAYQQEPHSIIWAIDWVGNLLGCTYDRSQDIVGWHHHHTDGIFECLKTIPYQNQDQAWMIIQRLIGGNVKRYVEYFSPDVCADSCIFYEGEARSTFYGFDHLIGKSVEIVGDGAPYPPQTVGAGGSITIDPPASKLYVGLGFTPRIITNRPEVQTGEGTSQGLLKRWNRIIVRVIETSGITINDQLVPPRITSDFMGQAPAPYTGDIDVENLEWDPEGRIKIEQTLPLSAEIVCITGSLTVGDL